MKATLMVGLGGFLGSIARYRLGAVILHHASGWKFPLSTFTINVCGCFMIGTLAALAEKQDFFSMETRLFLFTGVLGGFTTFSAFGLEGVFLFRRGEPLVAVLYALLSVMVGFAAVWLGLKLFSFGTHQ